MEDKSLKMKTMPIPKLIFSMSLPAMFSMLIQALYNIIDTVYVSQISEDSSNEINALGFSFPLQMIILGLSIGIGVGTSSLVSRKLGEGNKNEASKFATTGLVIAFITGLIITLLSFIIVKPYFSIATSDSYTYECGNTYLSIIMLFSLGSFIEICLSKILQGTGRMIIPMISQLIGAITNIILDPIMIFNLGLGIKGAAIATVIGQWAACIFTAIYFFLSKLDIKISFKNFKFERNIVSNIVKVGAPTAVMNSISSFTNLVINFELKKLDPSEGSIGILSVFQKLQSFIFMPVFGLTQGGLPILSYNYGSKNYQRYKKSAKILLITSFIVMSVGMICFQLFPNTLLSLFNMENEIEGIRCLTIVSLSFIPASIGVIISMMFQSIGKAFNSLFMTLLRQALGLIPASLLLAILFKKVSAVWYAFPFSELLCVIIFIPIIIKNVKKSFIELEDAY